MILRKKDSIEEFDVEAFIRNCNSFAPKRYTYTQIKKMTNSLANVIGKGGYGCVYKGILPDGRLVAMKVFKQSKSNGEDFINEVASMGRTSHVNIVTLIGFCYEMNERALIYDFMPNGSLDKFIFDQENGSTTRCLEWKKLFEIALGIARGLEYLHRGCNTRILHFDIKPQNILLDKDFCPKISDFGLAKLWLNKDSVVSLRSARGTAGYIAPEVFNKYFGGVSHKSDVYSYGMLVLEMVRGRKNIDPIVSHTSEIYFPYYIYKDIEMGKDLRILGVTTEEEKELARKMVLVSFWCIQTNPSDRPPMGKIVDMLEGNLQQVQIPPKPFLFSPKRSPQQSTESS
ncbi:PR5-like receptor kinase [Ziziphus jujuba]|uniref:PR5-like receptor kinase n=1 Tax=Ziziphus jujuba TaxID=326968 RepID=A0ABM3I835_ZIZJJ|nr:PR5-like receptor kinase [Ziziphus jujuba]